MFWYDSGNDLIRIWHFVGGGLVGCSSVSTMRRQGFGFWECFR